jgi:hypothetical protein
MLTTRGFIIYGQSRSGSTLLKELLNSHPDITCDGELLTMGWKYLDHPLTIKLISKYPYPYFNLRRLRSGSPVYGFKFMIFNSRKPGKVLQHLVRNHWKLIHIHRNNILKQSLSNIIAKETRHWHLKEGESPPDYRLEIPPEKLLGELNTRKIWSERGNRFLEGIPHLRLDYESDLEEEENWSRTAARLFSYLDLEYQPVSSRINKTDPRPYREVISNYDDLITSLEKSNYGHLLKDNQE